MEAQMKISMEAVFLIVGILFAILGILIILEVMSSIYVPETNLAVMNAQRLQSAINTVCVMPAMHEIEIEFTLPQKTMFSSALFADLRAFVLPLISMPIKLNGDPDYLLYYEAFPPGESQGWDFLVDTDYIALASHEGGKICRPGGLGRYHHGGVLGPGRCP